MRKLTTFEKAQFLNLPFFHDLCEIEALEVARYWVDYTPMEGDNLEELAKVKHYSNQLLSAGQVDKIAIVKTWLVLNDKQVEPVEKEGYGLQLVETAKEMLKEDGKPSVFREVMQATIVKKSEVVVDAPPVVLDGIKVEAQAAKPWWQLW